MNAAELLQETYARLSDLKERNLLSSDVETITMQHSHIDGPYVPPGTPVAVDVDRWPLYDKARSIEVTLEPGDMLFIPSFWWHWVFSDANSHGVNIFFDDEHSNPNSCYMEETGVGVLEPEEDIRAVFDQCRKDSKPCCLRRVAAHWEIIDTPIETLLKMEKCPLTRFVFSPSGSASLCPVEKPLPHYYGDTGVSVTVEDASALERHIEAHPSYSHQFTLMLRPQNGNFLSMVRVPSIVNAKDVRSINIWCNTKEAHTGLHYDGDSNLLVCTKG
eukprot:PhM_4_TR17043/c0_g1_i2/m.34808